jgi:hypothetical protein
MPVDAEAVRKREEILKVAQFELLGAALETPVAQTSADQEDDEDEEDLISMMSRGTRHQFTDAIECARETYNWASARAKAANDVPMVFGELSKDRMVNKLLEHVDHGTGKHNRIQDSEAIRLGDEGHLYLSRLAGSDFGFGVFKSYVACELIGHACPPLFNVRPHSAEFTRQYGLLSEKEAGALLVSQTLELYELHLGPNSESNLRKLYGISEGSSLSVARKRRLLLALYRETYSAMTSIMGTAGWCIHDLSHSLCESEKMDSTALVPSYAEDSSPPLSGLFCLDPSWLIQLVTRTTNRDLFSLLQKDESGVSLVEFIYIPMQRRSP